MATKEIGRGIGYNIGTDRGIVPSRFDTDFGELRRSVQSSQTPSDYYGTTGKRSTANGGVQQTVLVIDRGTNIAQAERAVQKSAEVIKGRGGVDPTVERIPFRAYEGTETLYGKEAKEALRRVVETYGGKITKIVGDEVSYTYAIAESEVQRHKASKHSPTKMFEQSAFREARSLSSRYAVEEAQKEQAQQEEKQRAEAEKARIKQEAEEEKKARKFEEIERKEYYRHLNYLNKQIAKYELKKVLSGQTYSEILGDEKDLMSKDDLLANYKKIEQENKQKREEKKQADRDKAQEASQSFARSAMMRMLFAEVLIIGNTLRRILTTIVGMAKETVKIRADSVEAHNMGMSYQTYRANNYLDLAHGLEEGTRNQGIADLQASFGDITNLNMGAIEKLAPVLGSGIVREINNGLGRDNPEQLFNQIMNAFFEQYREGRNHLNQFVGKDQARKELVTAIQQVSPSIAKELAMMIDTAEYGKYAGLFSSVESYDKLLGKTTGKYGLTDADIGVFKEVGTEVSEVTSKMKILADTMKNEVVVGLSGFIQWLNNFLDKISSSENKVENEAQAFSWFKQKEGGIRSSRELTKQDFIASFQAMTGHSLSDYGLTEEDVLTNSSKFKRFVGGSRHQEWLPNLLRKAEAFQIANEDVKSVEAIEKKIKDKKAIAGDVNKLLIDTDTALLVSRLEAKKAESNKLFYSGAESFVTARDAEYSEVQAMLRGGLNTQQSEANYQKLEQAFAGLVKQNIDYSDPKAFEQVLGLVGDKKKRNKLLEESGILTMLASKEAQSKGLKGKDKAKFEKKYKSQMQGVTNEYIIKEMNRLGILGENDIGNQNAFDFTKFLIAQYFKDDLGSLENIWSDALLSGLNFVSFGGTQFLGKVLPNAGKSLAYSELKGRDSSTNYEGLLNYLFTTKLKEAVARKIASDRTGKYKEYTRYEANLSSNAEGTALTVNLFGVKKDNSKELVESTEPIKFDVSQKIDKNVPIFLSF